VHCRLSREFSSCESLRHTYYLGKRSDTGCCITYQISAFVMEYLLSSREMASMNFMHSHANGNFREARNLYTEHYPQHRKPSRKLFTNFTSDWANQDPLVQGQISFERAVYGFTYLKQDSATEISNFMSVLYTG
jgi:hypothetical protein